MLAQTQWRIQDFEKGRAMISLRWISGFWIVGGGGEGGALRAEFALSTVATVTRVVDKV